MSRSYDPDNFFQTTESIQERNRKLQKSTNKNGQPIKTPSKVLAILPDPASNDRIYIAESSGCARRVELSTGNHRHLFTGPPAPLTSLALSTHPTNPTLFAGSWDRTIWAWSTLSRKTLRRYAGHSDFVKCLTYAELPSLSLLISGAADTLIILWDANTGTKLHAFTGHAMGVLSLAIDPATYPLSTTSGTTPDADLASRTHGQVVLFSASSDGAILRWSLIPTPRDPTSRITATPLQNTEALLPHASTVYALAFAPATADPEPDLWTAGADGMVKCLSRNDNWTPDTKLEQGSHVRCVALSADARFVVSSGRNEDVWVWDAGSGEQKARFTGHFDEVMGVVVMGSRAVSCGLDCTVRVWDLGPLQKEERKRRSSLDPDGVSTEAYVDSEEAGAVAYVGAAVAGGMDADAAQQVSGHGNTAAMISTEEEMELNALMADEPFG